MKSSGHHRKPGKGYTDQRGHSTTSCFTNSVMRPCSSQPVTFRNLLLRRRRRRCAYGRELRGYRLSIFFNQPRCKMPQFRRKPIQESQQCTPSAELAAAPGASLPGPSRFSSADRCRKSRAFQPSPIDPLQICEGPGCRLIESRRVPSFPLCSLA